MTSLKGRPQSRADQRTAGKALRTICPRESHADWKPSPDRRDPVTLVLAAEKGRLPDLLPLRHGRLVRSPFTFFRGTALTMAADLAPTRATGLRVQCCGDAHLSNFGGFATPERRVIFSMNDLDETLPAPWEWDVKRLAASFVVASRDNGLRETAARDAAMTCVRTYRESMAEFSEMKTLDLWYFALEADALVAGISDPGLRRRAVKRLQKERAKSIAEDLFPKLVEGRRERVVIKNQLPAIFHAKGHPPGKVQEDLKAAFAGYRKSLVPAYQFLLDRYEIRDAAVKVVGIGSVGTSCAVLLLMAGEGNPLFLQIKEARPSVSRGIRRRECLRHSRRASRQRLSPPAARQRHLPWMDPRCSGHAPLFRPPVERHQDQHQCGGVRRQRDGPLCHVVRPSAGSLARSFGGIRHAQRIHGQARCVRQGHCGLLGGLR